MNTEKIMRVGGSLRGWQSRWMVRLLSVVMVVAGMFTFTACSNDDEAVKELAKELDAAQEESPAQGSLKELNIDAGTIVKLASGLGGWDEGYVTKSGLFLYNGSSQTKATKADPEPEPSATSTLYYSNADGTLKASLIVQNADRRPLQLVLNEGVLNFSWLSDEVMELVFSKGSDITYVDQVNYDKASLDAAIQSISEDNNLHRSLYYLARTVNVEKVAAYPTVRAAVAYFYEVTDMTYDATATVTPEEAGLTVSEDGTCVLVQQADEFEETVVEPIFSTLTIWTGMASFKVGGSSCTLNGSVFCSDQSYVTLGKVGIVCDEDPAKLYSGQAEFEGTAELTEGQSNFGVDFRGFKAETTYYYRAFYQFNSEDHGTLQLDSRQSSGADFAYDNVIKSFTTDENKLTVQVVMCVDISGSMSGTINMVKSNATSFYSLFSEKCDAAGIKLLGLSARVVAFSDINVDGERSLFSSEEYDLNDEAGRQAYTNYVNSKLVLAYGGDTPESALEAMADAMQNTSWGEDDGYHRQIVILWTDAAYKTVNGGICRDAEGNEMFTPYSYGEVQSMWNAMPSGRRMILFAPVGTSGYNYGSWSDVLDWKNVKWGGSAWSDLSDFSNSLDYIIEELTGKEETTRAATQRVPLNQPYRSND